MVTTKKKSKRRKELEAQDRAFVKSISTPEFRKKRQQELASDKPLRELSTTIKAPTKEKTVKERSVDVIKARQEQREQNRATGLTRVMDVISAPLSQTQTLFEDGITAAADAVQEKREAIQQGDFKEAAKVIGNTIMNTVAASGLVLGAGAGAQAVARGTSAVSTLMKIGRTGRIAAGNTIVRDASGVMRYATNPKSVATTSKWFKNMGLSIPASAALLGAIGTYPFAGFIKEEALQTLSMSSEKAIETGDLEGAQIALQQEAELLNPTVWGTILSSIPYANVLAKLKNFYDAAATAHDNKIRRIEELVRDQQGEGQF